MARSSRMLRWARDGAVLAALLSLVSLMLPPPWSYLPWNDADFAFHNAVAILVRITVFALVGAALGAAWHHRRRRRRR